MLAFFKNGKIELMTRNTEDEEFTKNLIESFFDAVDSDTGLGQDGIHFDLWAKPLSAFEWAKEYVPGLVVSSAGGFVPYQAEGLINGFPFYYRAEWDYSSINIGHPDEPAPYLWDEALWTATINDFEGSTHASFIEALTRLLPKLERTPHLYRFPCHAYEFTGPNGSWEWSINKDDTDYVQGIGMTPEEGYQKASEPSAYLAERGFTPERQREFFVAKEPAKTPLAVKERKYPSPEPVFHSTPFFAE